MDKIYILREPLNYSIRYVGYTHQELRQRLKEHKYESMIKRSHKNNWLRSLYSSGLAPIIEEIELVGSEFSWADRERYWIKYYRSVGCDLTNGTDGGECGSGRLGCVLTEEHKAKIKAKTNTVDAIVRNRNAQRCRAVTTPRGDYDSVRLAAKLIPMARSQVEYRVKNKIDGWRYIDDVLHKSCVADGCDNCVTAKDLCNKHYKRLKQYGTTEPGIPAFVAKPKGRRINA